MSEKYIQENFSEIIDCANIIKGRKDSDCSSSMNYLIKDNMYNLIKCKQMN